MDPKEAECKMRSTSTVDQMKAHLDDLARSEELLHWAIKMKDPEEMIKYIEEHGTDLISLLIAIAIFDSLCRLDEEHESGAAEDLEDEI